MGRKITGRKPGDLPDVYQFKNHGFRVKGLVFMKNTYFILFLLGCILIGHSQTGFDQSTSSRITSTGIPADSEAFVAWATGIEVVRGYVDISNPEFEVNGSNFASYGEPENALGPATNIVVSLGDAGEAVLTFAEPIIDGLGYDFAVFENGFDDTFLELAFVEVSSNGIDYFRFPSHSQTQTGIQVGAFDPLDPTKIHNLAGKYRALFGTPFDLSDIEDDPSLDKNNITHVKIIDVVGSIDPEYARYDSFGNIINDPFNTPFASSGFDLDAVGVINEKTLSVNDNSYSQVLKLYPNPTSDYFFIENIQEYTTITILSTRGKIIGEEVAITSGEKVDVDHFQPGIYLVKIKTENGTNIFKLVKSKL